MGRIVIAGPGRAGTTLLVQILERLGFETGQEVRGYFPEAHAGLEHDLMASGPSQVVKNPDLTWQLRGLLDRGQILAAEIDWLIVPLRDLANAAESRVSRTLQQRDVHAAGGLVGTKRPSRQATFLAQATYGLLETAALYEIPTITLVFPMFAENADYAFRRLQPMLTVEQETFRVAWISAVDPQLVRHDGFKVPSFADARVAVLRTRRAVKRQLLSAVRRQR